jgi:hypothetical protein
MAKRSKSGPPMQHARRWRIGGRRLEGVRLRAQMAPLAYGRQEEDYVREPAATCAATAAGAG